MQLVAGLRQVAYLAGVQVRLGAGKALGCLLARHGEVRQHALAGALVDDEPAEELGGRAYAESQSTEPASPSSLRNTLSVMSGKRVEWDFAFRIRGVTPKTLPMARLAEYLRVYAELLGEGNEPRFAGIVSGSALMRAQLPYDKRLDVKLRLMSAESNAAPGPGYSAVEKLSDMLEHDGLTGEVEDRQGAVILQFRRPERKDAPAEHVVYDTGVLDGVLVGLVGLDDTVHLRLQDVGGKTYKVILRDIGMARQLARHFRGDPLRAHVHGSWKRTADGQWVPHALYLDRFEETSDEPASAILARLSGLPGNRWSTMDDPERLLRDLRSDE